MELNTILNMDCLVGMKQIKDKSVDLVVIDPPYNIKKAAWDSWETVGEYVEFMGKVFAEIQRVLKDSGSFYFFHNDFLQIVELQNWINENSDFIFKQLIVWNKRFEGAALKGYLDGHCAVNNLRNYKQMAEYCLFYTFQDETSINNFKTLRNYFERIQSTLNVTKKSIIERIGQSADHCFRWNSSQWDLPTEETYQRLIDVYGIDKLDFFRSFEDLRREYEDLRYTFNNLKEHHSIMNFEVAKKRGHITPKPVELLKYLIETSSNENDIVLDCFMGSGSTAIACLETNRNFIGFEKDKDYYDIANKRIDNYMLAYTE